MIKIIITGLAQQSSLGAMTMTVATRTVAVLARFAVALVTHHVSILVMVV